jgi:hypothetical protein
VGRGGVRSLGRRAGGVGRAGRVGADRASPPAPRAPRGWRGRRRVSDTLPRVGGPSLVARGRGRATGSPSAAAAAAARPRSARGSWAALCLGHGLATVLLQATIGQATELDPQARRDVPHGVERTVVGHDLDEISGAGRGQPDPGGNGDAKVAPVANARRWGAVDEVSPPRREQPGSLVTHHPPVCDSHELGPTVPGIDAQVVDHVRQVLRAARVLDVQEDRAPSGGAGTLRLHGRHARGERALDGRDRKRKRLGLLNDRGNRRDFRDGKLRDRIPPLGLIYRFLAASGLRRWAGGVRSPLLLVALAVRASRHSRPSLTHDDRSRPRPPDGRRPSGLRGPDRPPARGAWPGIRLL